MTVPVSAMVTTFEPPYREMAAEVRLVTVPATVIMLLPLPKNGLPRTSAKTSPPVSTLMVLFCPAISIPMSVAPTTAPATPIALLLPTMWIPYPWPRTVLAAPMLMSLLPAKTEMPL